MTDTEALRARIAVAAHDPRGCRARRWGMVAAPRLLAALGVALIVVAATLMVLT
jgi:hypothetical protein